MLLAKLKKGRLGAANTEMLNKNFQFRSSFPSPKSNLQKRIQTIP